MKLKKFECKRCGHVWIPRREKLSVTCPKCRSPYWNKERRIVNGNAKKSTKKL